MLKLRPLVVITGTIRVEGGVRKGAKFTEDRARANVIIVDHARTLRKRRLLRTPFGSLYATDQLAELKGILDAITRDVAAFNESAKQTPACRLQNCLIWEPLANSRRAAVEGWIAARNAERDAAVAKAMPALLEPQVAAAG